MCLGSLFSKPKAPAMPPIPPAPAPTPVPTPSEVSPQMAGDARRKQLERLRRGLSATVKSRGITGGSAELSPAVLQGSRTLG